MFSDSVSILNIQKKSPLTLQDQLLAMDVQQDPVSIQGGNCHSHDVDLNLKDRLFTALLQSSAECYEAVASRMLKNCNTMEVQNVANKLSKFLR